nr:hypothetical protein K-LCC10_0026 [Kaumoebavirus]
MNPDIVSHLLEFCDNLTVSALACTDKTFHGVITYYVEKGHIPAASDFLDAHYLYNRSKQCECIVCNTFTAVKGYAKQRGKILFLEESSWVGIAKSVLATVPKKLRYSRDLIRYLRVLRRYTKGEGMFAYYHFDTFVAQNTQIVFPVFGSIVLILSPSISVSYCCDPDDPQWDIMMIQRKNNQGNPVRSVEDFSYENICNIVREIYYRILDPDVPIYSVLGKVDMPALIEDIA